MTVPLVFSIIFSKNIRHSHTNNLCFKMNSTYYKSESKNIYNKILSHKEKVVLKSMDLKSNHQYLNECHILTAKNSLP